MTKIKITFYFSIFVLCFLSATVGFATTETCQAKYTGDGSIVGSVSVTRNVGNTYSISGDIPCPNDLKSTGGAFTVEVLCATGSIGTVDVGSCDGVPDSDIDGADLSLNAGQSGNVTFDAQTTTSHNYNWTFLGTPTGSSACLSAGDQSTSGTSSVTVSLTCPGETVTYGAATISCSYPISGQIQPRALSAFRASASDSISLNCTKPDFCSSDADCSSGDVCNTTREKCVPINYGSCDTSCRSEVCCKCETCTADGTDCTCDQTADDDACNDGVLPADACSSVTPTVSSSS